MILILDNYDSFTYNLVHSIIQEDFFEDDKPEKIVVIRNDEVEPEDLRFDPRAIIISPGPGRPKDAGFCEKYIDYYKNEVPILGICLGHQVICENYGACVTHASRIVHGKQDKIYVDSEYEEDPIFDGLESPFLAGRYHSLSVKEDTLPQDLVVLAKSDDGEVMAIKDKNKNIYGLQFHPESILTPEGKRIIKNFLKLETNDDTRSN